MEDGEEVLYPEFELYATYEVPTRDDSVKKSLINYLKNKTEKATSQYLFSGEPVIKNTKYIGTKPLEIKEYVDRLFEV